MKMKTRRWKLDSIRIYGEKEGMIWMPCATATKVFDEKFTYDDRPYTRTIDCLRDALLYITNDGDFRTCEIVHAVMQCRYVDDGNRRLTVERELQGTGYNADLFQKIDLTV
jgi:hypothetical protein